MKVDEFDYDLPPELVAQKPVEPRDASRLLVLSRATGNIEHRRFYELGQYLEPGDVLVLNNTRVIPARLLGVKSISGARAEVFLLARREEDLWEVMVRPGKRLKPGTTVEFGDGLLTGEIVDYAPGGNRLIRFRYEGLFEYVLDTLGEMPLPPYIKEKLEDPERYQTVYAQFPGSAAAPTAGLHFTPGLLSELEQRGVQLVNLLLHVGLGTFRPVQATDISQHQMHAEYYELTRQAAQTINEARNRGGRIVAVGTTSVRTLETAADQEGIIHPGSGWTDIFIYPGYRYRAVDAMVTNFHLPKSTLLMLVSAFASREKILEAYYAAIKERYRFYSFGDAMLIL